MKITWFGHASFRIDLADRKIAYIDPYVLPANAPLGDLVLITHGHHDHCDPSKVGQVASIRTSIIGSREVAASLSGRSVTVLEPGKSEILEFARVTAVPAYNVNRPFHPRGSGLGFILESEGRRIYHAGDTDIIPEMGRLRSIDVALLPIGGTYTMGIREAVKAVETIRPETAVPMHYNYIEGVEADPEDFRSRVISKGRTRVEILGGGKTLKL